MERSTCKILPKQRITASSRSCANPPESGAHCPNPVVGARGSTEKQQQPCCLHVSHVWDPVQQDLVLLPFDGQLCCDERLMPNWRSQHDISCCCGANCASPLHTTASGSTPTGCSPLRGSKSVFFHSGWISCRRIRRTANTLSGAQVTYTSSRNANRDSPSRNLAFAATNALCRLRQKSRGTRGSPCSPSSPCGITYVLPNSSSQRYVDGCL